jgi:hypothetical protein
MVKQKETDLNLEKVRVDVLNQNEMNSMGESVPQGVIIDWTNMEDSTSSHPTTNALRK